MKIKLYEIIKDNHPRFFCEYEDERVPEKGTCFDVFCEDEENDVVFEVQFERIALIKTREKTTVSQHSVFVKRIS